MTRFPRCAALVLCVSSAVLALGPTPARCAPDLPPFPNRTEAFRRILFELKFTPLTRFSDLQQAPPGDTLLVVLGQTDWLNGIGGPAGLRAFVERGGAVLVATDRPADLGLLAGVKVSGQSYVFPGDAALRYHKMTFCPLLVPEEGATPDLFRAPFRPASPGRLAVATNVPSCLKVTRPRNLLPPLAHLPAGSVLEKVWTTRLMEEEPLFAVGGDIGEGRVLVLADHSIFINQMMIPTDNGNAEFAWNCLQWLQEGTGGQRRTRALFVEDSRINDDFKVPLKEGPVLPPDTIREGVRVLEKTLAELEDRGAFDAFVLDHLGATRYHWPDRLLRRALEILTGLLLVYLVYRVAGRGRFRLDTAVPLLAHEVARHTPGAPLLEQRYRAALKVGNLWETAHSLARQWVAGLPVVAGGTPAPQGSAPPRVVVRGGWRERLGLRRRFRRLWRLAHDTTPVRVSPRALRGLLRDVDELKAALADGRLLLQ